MATKRRKNTRRRSTRRRRLGALPVYPNAMGIMGTSAMLGPVVVGLGGTPAEHAAELNVDYRGLRFVAQELESDLKDGSCADIARGIVAVSKAIGRVEAEQRYVRNADPSRVRAASEVLARAFRALPNSCRR